MYDLFKFLHIVAVIVWIGGYVSTRLLGGFVLRHENRTVFAAVLRQARTLGGELVLPAAVFTLLSGIAMMAVTGWGVPLWIAWGFAAIVLSVALGVIAHRPLEAELLERSQSESTDDVPLAAIHRRLAVVSIVNVLLLLSAVWAMVFKPG